MLAKYKSPVLTAARPSAYLVRPSYLRTNLATRPSSFLRDRSSFQLRRAYSEAAKDAEKVTPKTEWKWDQNVIQKQIIKSTGGLITAAIGATIALMLYLLTSNIELKNRLKNKKESDLLEQRKNEEAVLHAIEKGSYPDPDPDQSALITRKDIIDKLQNIFRRSYDYHLVVGEHGTGKTTVIVQAAKAVEQGVVYVKGSSDLDKFSKSFADALGWSYEFAITEKERHDSKDKLDRAMEAFRRAAAKYKAKHNKPAVLILDDISGLAKTHPKIIVQLQDVAKDVADGQEFTFVFVASEGTIPTMMSTNSAWSRASKSPLLIGDFTEEEALTYLKDKLKLKGGAEGAKKLYNLLGGRIKLLQSYGGEINAGTSFEDVRKAAFIEATGHFRAAGIKPKGEFESTGKKIIQELVKRKDKIMTRNEFDNFVDDGKNADKLLQANVFSYNVVEGTVTFQSRLIESYVMANPKEFGLE